MFDIDRYSTVLDMQTGFGKYRKALAATKKNFDRLAELSLIGIGFAKLWSQTQIMTECEQMHTRAVWWSKLAALDISFDRRAFEANPADYAGSLVPALMKATKCNVEYVTQFGTDHGMDSDALVAQVIPLLIEMAAPCEDVSKNTKFETEYQVQIENALSHVADKSMVLATLDTQYRELVGPYDYGRLRFLFKLVLALEAEVMTETRTKEATTRVWAQNGLLLLEVLWHYRRKAPPAAEEIEYVSSLPQTKQIFSKADQTMGFERLPFHILAYGDALSVITPELCLETAHSLSPLAKLLPGDLKPDDFLVTLLQRLLETDTGDSLPTLEQLRPIYSKISDDDTAVMAATKIIADSYPVGENKVSALTIGIERAISWTGRLPEGSKERQKAEGIRVRLTCLRNAVETEFLLKTNNLATKDSTALIETPKALVEHLYESYLVPCSTSLSRLATLHRVVDDIAVRHSFDCGNLRKTLIQRWLSTPRKGCESETAATMHSDAPLSLVGILDEEDDDDDTSILGNKMKTHAFPIDTNLTRAAIMLRHSPTDDAIQQLVRIA